MKQVLLRDAMRIAREKFHRHDQREYWPHYSFIVQNNKILDWATNTSTVPERHFGYHERLGSGLPKSHAEFNCYKKTKGLLAPNKAFEIINIRLSKDGENMRMSAPCNCCHQFLAMYGCRECWFSTDAGWASMKISA